MHAIWRGKDNMAESKKSSGILIIVVIMALAGVIGAYMMFGRSAQAPLPEVQGDIDVAHNDNAVHSGAAVQQEANQQDGEYMNHMHTHDHDASATNQQSSLFDDLKKPNPLTVHPVLGVRTAGNPNAPVKVTELFSLSCSHCAAFHNETFPEIKKNFIDTGKIFYVYQEFPLNAPALHASMIARCLPEERYEGFIALLFKTQEKWISAPDYKEALRQDAKLAGMSDEEFDACLNNSELQQAIASTIQEASEKWGIKSTPSIIFNDGEKVVVGAQQYPPMENALNQFIARAKSQTTAKAAE